ncbi:MAG: hypothetical protein IPH44_04170 [Myxococcales bacterium]|jgi:hypothetical protein|nr:hypothetical protein [Myxococcales bacterium]MBK7193851.1 hypothetical protein [Myxococcales bacterium]MBP6847220.1 hypothetical protein [Kofleriaceae bacterium]
MADDRSRSRRAFLSGLGRSAALVVGTGALAKVAVASPGKSPPPPVDDVGASGPPAPVTTRVHDDLPPPPDAAVHAFLAPLAVGATFGGWTLARIHGVFRGGLPLVLAHADGRRAQIDLLRHDAASPPGIAATGAGHLYLVNSGRGTRPTPPDLEAAIAQLAQALRHRGGDALALTSQAERHRRFPGGVYVVPA